MLKIVVAGAGGRMGRTLIDAVNAAPDLVLHGALEIPSSPLIGQPAATASGRSAVMIDGDLLRLPGADALIDFTRPAGTLGHLDACVAAKVPIVIGTTGFSDSEKEQIESAAAIIPIVFAPNMSVGVNVTLRLLEVAAAALSEGFDIEILEMHHRHKIDAPSGTALGMGEAIARAQGRSLKDAAVYSREGVTGERDPSSIGFAVLRGGDCVGEHT
ncbi:MAG: 4-hydroxy-tetrahydrodipicolinate reductase, partial [Betaproteobacteria bacterium]